MLLAKWRAPQHHFQKLIDISYDFKLYRKFEDKGVSLRSFCTNNNAAYVAVEEHTYVIVSAAIDVDVGTSLPQSVYVKSSSPTV